MDAIFGADLDFYYKRKTYSLGLLYFAASAPDVNDFVATRASSPAGFPAPFLFECSSHGDAPGGSECRSLCGPYTCKKTLEEVFTHFCPTRT